jgi:hypothetical protein
VCTNSKMPDNLEAFDGLTLLFMSQKLTVPAMHKQPGLSPAGNHLTFG